MSCPKKGIKIKGCSTESGSLSALENTSASHWKINKWVPFPHSR